MIVEVKNRSRSVRQCVAEIYNALDANGWSPQRAYSEVVAPLERLAGHDDLLETTLPVPSTGHSAEAQRIYWDGTINLLLARFAANEVVPIHNHGTWQVVGTYRGRVSYQAFRRRDDGGRAGYAELEITQDQVLGPGEFALVPEPPDDLHGFTPVGGDMWMLVMVYGSYAPMRLYFDLETKTVTTQAHAYYKG